MLASILLKEVAGKLASPVCEQLALLWNFKTDLDEMISTLVTIDAVLCEAEKQFLKDRAVHHWLKELKLVSYQIDDLLADFEIQDPEQTEVVCDDVLNKVCCLRSVFNCNRYIHLGSYTS